MSPLEAAIEAIDHLHAEDPQTREVDGVDVPAELDYARRMSAALETLVDAPSDALRLAVRAQHLQRWRIGRDDYPRTKPGYHAWRKAQAKAHAELAAATLRPLGFDDATVARVESLVRKKDRASDPEAQALEDAACLVFLETQLGDFAEGRDEAQLVSILQKTWAKMSARGRDVALALTLDDAAKDLLTRALA